MTSDLEIVLNLWYIYDEDGIIYSLRARCYVASGTDEEKLTLLRQFAATDYLIAQPFPIPERFHTRLLNCPEQPKLSIAAFQALQPDGGVQILFEDAFKELDKQLPMQTKLTIGSDPLVCITPLLADDNDKLHPQTERQGRL
jgi:hypothetical protein